MRRKKSERAQQEALPIDASGEDSPNLKDKTKPNAEATSASTDGVSPEPTEETDAAIEPSLEEGIVNTVDTKGPGTGIVLSGGDPVVLDVTVEEPDYPLEEWQDTSATGLVVPNETMADQSLCEGILQMQGRIAFQLRRTLPEHWMIGKGLHILFARHGQDQILIDSETGKTRRIRSNWRKEWLPRFGYNHTSDQQLRVLAETYSLEDVRQFASKTEALRACGFSVGKMAKAIEHANKGPEDAALGEVDSRQSDKKLSTRPSKSASRPEARKIAAKAAPQAEPLEEDPMVGTEALVVTLEGAADADLEAVVAESGLTPIAKTPGRVVALLWYSDDTFDAATKKVGKALDRLRPEKPKLQVEARYLCASEVVPV